MSSFSWTTLIDSHRVATNWKNLEKLLKPGYKCASWKTWKKPGISKKSWKSWENILRPKMFVRFWKKLGKKSWNFHDKYFCSWNNCKLKIEKLCKIMEIPWQIFLTPWKLSRNILVLGGHSRAIYDANFSKFSIGVHHGAPLVDSNQVYTNLV